MEEELTAYDEATEEGEIRGEIKGRNLLLLRLGRRQFGALDASTEAELTSIRDLDRLDRLGDAISTAKSWQELLETA